MEKLLVICGPTATGKTSLAISLAKKFNGELISADSRQVYKGMDIGTGKEWGKNVEVWGYDLVDPKKEFSVAQYLRFTIKKIEDVEKRGRLPILVGGTGLYIKGVVDGIPTVNVPINKKLREILEKKSADELYEMLSQIDSMKAASLNFSDHKNPRRLVRAVEVATWMIDNSNRVSHFEVNKNRSVLFIGLTSKKEILDSNIGRRVDERVKKGIKEEIKNLIKNGLNWDNQSMMSLGYREWRDYFEGGVEEETIIEEWKKDERKYAKRQMTWFKKDKRVVWFDIADSGYVKKVEKMVEKWFNKRDAKKS